MPGLHRRTIFSIILVLAAAIWYFPTRSTSSSSSKQESIRPIQNNGEHSSVVAASTASASTGTGNATGLCSDPPRGHCEFYRDCLEAKFHCGPDGYPIGYGEKYCEKFQTDQSELSSAGQEWMLNTMQCLQRALVPEEDSSTSTSTSGGQQTDKCDDIKQTAFASHAACYIDNGLCTLGVGDWAHIVEIIGIQTLLGSWDAVKEAFETAEGCLDFYAFLLIHG
ncbi:hypothetical protein CPB84DRAFT_1710821 [Gymnopilus junonius]|uniref:Uncharacterized protein n=1 Tax=Gymnopilus junonius TaxID=109634 RepID=A0A9P5NKV5_GYMJU|nr:hypothetical protein CPB84DRAFT_1710821 [Gymnopilus junonius]